MQMNKILSLCIIILCLNACNSVTKMKENEIDLINNGSIDAPYRVLLTTDKKDSLFLRQKSVDLDINSISKDKDLQFFIKRLKLTMDIESGVGIAAPQVGLGRNIFLFTRIDKPETPVQVAINPRITAHSDEVICFERDGCLSIPGISGNSSRYAWVDVEYYDESGIIHREHLSGHSREADFTGVIFQHEYDHLQGVLFIDKLCQ